jgi:nicotinamidase-related amidase
VQEGAPIEIPRARAMVPRLNRLLAVCRAHQIPVMYIHHVIRGGDIDAGRLADHHEAIRNNHAILAGTPNVEIYEGLTPQPGDLVVAKPRYSAFYGTDLEAILRSQGIDTLIIGGTVTNVCCESTTRDAFSRDDKEIFLSDGTAAGDLPDLGFGPVSAEEIQRVVLQTASQFCGSVPFSVKEKRDGLPRQSPRHHVLTSLFLSSMVCRLSHGHRCLPSGHSTRMIPQCGRKPIVSVHRHPANA